MPRIIKLVSANISNYFETNKIEKRDSIPLSGNYTKGDLIINTGVDSTSNPMWICTETGTPGKWAPVTSGNSYTHHDTHPATMITEDSTHRFVTDEEKTKWDAKASTDVVTTFTNGLMSKDDKVKVNGIGDKTQLKTSNKDNLVSAINEIKGRVDEAFQNANNGKKIIAAAIGSPVSSDDTFNAMGAKIDVLTQEFKDILNEKGVSVNSEDNISSLINKANTLQLGKKTASGNTVVSASKISVRGLNFKPRFIHGWQTGHNAGDKRNVVYCSSPQIDICCEYGNYFEGYGESIIYDDGFDLWVGNAKSGTTINWQVYE